MLKKTALILSLCFLLTPFDAKAEDVQVAESQDPNELAREAQQELQVTQKYVESNSFVDSNPSQEMASQKNSESDDLEDELK